MQWAAGIRRLRQSNGWKQATLADMMGVDQATVSRWERGLQTPELSMRRRLVDLMRRRLPEVERLQLVAVQASPNHALAFDQDLRVLAASEAGASLFGRAPAELVGDSLHGRLPKDFTWALDRAREAGLWRGEVAAMRFVAALDSGPGCMRHARVAWTPVFAAAGDVVVFSQLGEISAEEYHRADRLAIVAMRDLGVA